MSRAAKRGASLIALALALVALPFGVGAAWFALRAAPATGPVTELRTALLRCGLGAEALAAAGCTAQETSALVDAFSEAMASQPSALEQKDAAYASARVTKEELERKVATGLATPEQITALGTAKSTLASAESARAQLLNGFFEGATAHLSAAKIATLSMLRANAAHELPIEFLVKERSQAEWLAIRKALNNERICAKYGDPPDAAKQAALATWKSDATVSAAKSACTSGLASVQDAWDAATGG
jgi:hypothetical protein